MTKTILDAESFKEALNNIAKQIITDNTELTDLAIVGLHSKGVFLSERIKEILLKFSHTIREIPLGAIDITLYRDDIDNLGLDMPIIKDTEIPFDVNNKNIILIDDVLFTGRTVKAALDVLTSFGRPKTIKLAVLVDRGNRELPIEANFIGFKYFADKKIKVECKEIDGEDRVVIL
jgi:pyrimidine operon attenuation protein/uracil phosphoribosyltransferase